MGDKMENLYILSNCTSEKCYDSHIKVIRDSCSKTFSPRKSIDNTESLIQVKSSCLGKLAHVLLDLALCENCKLVGQGDINWVKTVVVGDRWDSPIK